MNEPSTPQEQPSSSRQSQRSKKPKIWYGQTLIFSKVEEEETVKASQYRAKQNLRTKKATRRNAKLLGNVTRRNEGMDKQLKKPQTI